MCNCRQHVRLWQETEGGKYPPSEHAPTCEDYRQERFVRLEYDGASCVMEPHEAEALIATEREIEYRISDVYLTRDQFEAIPEFGGF